MLAWCVTDVGEPEAVITLRERDVPTPGPGEVQVRVCAAGLGLPDVLMCRGEYVFTPELPYTPGQEVAGVVSAVGEGCSVAVGERVMGVTAFYAGNGGFAEYCIVPEFSLYPVSAALGNAEAAAFAIPYHTAWVALKLRANIQSQETLLVHGGAGGSGSAAIQLAKALGARVIATASSPQKLAYCRDLGADECINYRQNDFVSEVLALTQGNGADVVFDPVGGEIYERTVACTNSGGRLLAVGFASGRWGKADTHELVMRNCSALGVFVGAYDHDEMLVHHARLLALHAEGKIAVQIDAPFEFANIAASLGKLARREAQGKLVARVAGE